jgi:3-deoxy-D-manno-octulosonate 8-phosphate phosphatase (KDO 8-P phosphatase)
VRVRAAGVRLVALDSDGTLTDGGMGWDDQGREWRRFHVRDGLAMRWARDAGLGVVVISGRTSEASAMRFAELGIEGYQGVKDKVGVLARLCAERGLGAPQVAFLGDDLPDLAALRWCGLPLAVADAHPRVRRVAAWTAPSCGGQGAAREALEAILDATGLWPGVLARYGERS